MSELQIALLRGINVSGQKIIKMADLKILFEQLGFEQVSTYIQSGNILFISKISSKYQLVEKIKTGIKKAYGYDVEVMITTKKELEAMLQNNPFAGDSTLNSERFYFTLLNSIPDKALLEKMLSLDFGEDKIAVASNVAYLYIPVSYGNTKLSNNFIEQKLKVSGTTRNLKTIKKLIELASK